MTVYDPQTYRTLVARPGEVAYKFYSVNKLMQDMAAANLVSLATSVDAPADTTMLWLDINAPEAEGGVTKAYSGVASQVATPVPSPVMAPTATEIAVLTAEVIKPLALTTKVPTADAVPNEPVVALTVASVVVIAPVPDPDASPDKVMV